MTSPNEGPKRSLQLLVETLTVPQYCFSRNVLTFLCDTSSTLDIIVVINYRLSTASTPCSSCSLFPCLVAQQLWIVSLPDQVGPGGFTKSPSFPRFGHSSFQILCIMQVALEECQSTLLFDESISLICQSI